MQFLGIDLAWGEGTAEKPANETGLALLDEHGTILDAGWARGVDEVAAWILEKAEPGAVIAIDAPLVIPNATGNRKAESEVGVGYGKWKVAANPSNQGMGWQAGVTLLTRLTAEGFVYSDGLKPAKSDERTLLEVYPFTTLVGMWELGYDDERPRYKRLVPKLPPAEAKAIRATAFDDLVQRMAALVVAETPIDLSSNPVTATLRDEASPVLDGPYKHREDLLDAALCAWTAAIWSQHPERVQVLGATDEQDADGHRPTIVAPARPEQRVASRAKPKREPAAKRGASVDSALTTVRELQQLTATLTTRLRALERELGDLRQGPPIR
jgi:predicted RNase H-like nuclease